MASDMITIDASAMTSVDYSQAIYDYFSSLGTTAGASTFYGGTFTEGFGYYSGTQVGFRYAGTTNDAQVLIEGTDIAYDGIYGEGHGISGSIDSFTLGSYDSNTTYTQDDEAGTRSELSGVISGLVVSGLDYSADIGTGTGEDNLVYQLYNALRKANTVVDLDGDGDSGYEYVDLIYDLLSQSAQHFIGSAGDDSYTGTDNADLIEGNDGDDTLDGGAGSDTMTGGLGDDIYVVDDSGDEVTEADGEGTDTVQTSLNHYQIGDYIENLTLTGTSALFGYGNALDNALTGNSGANSLYGLAGADTIDGGEGADSMVGGANDDIYIVDNSGDVTKELDAGGTDTVKTTLNHYQIGDYVENLTLTGTSDLFGYGNTLNNTLTGNDGANNLYGLTGIDTLIGGLGNDVLDGGEGVDAMTGGAGDDTYTVDDSDDEVTEADGEGTDTVKTALNHYQIGDFTENLTLTGSDSLFGYGNDLDNTLTGNTGANSLFGMDGNDTLDGGTGADTLTGGAGDDTYVVDDAGDTVTEEDGEGSDTVETTLSYTLGDFLDNLTLTGTEALTGTGNALANILTGNTGVNKLFGLDGDDTLNGDAGNDVLKGALGADILKGGADSDKIYGGGGQDELYGNAGSDTFFFVGGDTASAKAEADTIFDFNRKQGDLINLAGIDANEDKSGNQKFDFIGTDAFSGEAGELRFVSKNGESYVYGDTDGDAKADFTIHFDDAFTFKATDFAL
jgi:Ca2+-binding RTX toxin-like protein